MWFFRSPTIVFGEEALLHIRELRGKNAFVITDKTINENGILAPVLFQLGRAGMEFEIYDDIEAEPNLNNIERARDACVEYAPEWIVAVGGGSVIDAAKAVWIAYENPDIDLAVISPIEPITLREKARMIAVPTTAGTGSETTWAFVLSEIDDDTLSPRKVGSGHPLAVPDYAVVDPIMSASMPEEMTADTGMDALTQAVEAYLATWANDFTDGLALVATKIAFEFLPRAYADPKDILAREKMANCASIGGLAYINSMVGLAHSMGHAFGAAMKVPHGRAVGLFLPYVLEFYGSRERLDNVETRMTELCRFINIEASDEHDASMKLADKVRALMKEIEQPLTIAEGEISEDEFRDALEAMVDNAINDTVIFSSPRQPSERELRQLFECAFDGRTVDF
jgi:alcohol dehydrogenase class IV